MKGFPNQVADLAKIAIGINCLVRLVDAGENAKDDGVFGVALVHTGVAGTGHQPKPIDQYIEEQLEKSPSNQSFRTTARGLRELYRLMGLIDDSGAQVAVTDLGRQAAEYAGAALDAHQIEFWRGVINNIEHHDERGVSHPYQVMLRLVARQPGISRAKCALALEARNDTADELERIIGLAALTEDEILEHIGITKSNWDNAKKVLPKFAEQLGDVIRTGHTYVIADAPGSADAETQPQRRQRRAPAAARVVTPETIGIAGTVEGFDEVDVPPPEIDPEGAANAVALRRTRLRRHNLLLRRLADRLVADGAQLTEAEYDALVQYADNAVLVEVKTLDGTEADERERVRDALSQLLYYEAFIIPTIAPGIPIRKVACFEAAISEAHCDFLQDQGIAPIWEVNDAFDGGHLAYDFLRGRLIEFD